jgi:hypothetical protein
VLDKVLLDLTFQPELQTQSMAALKDSTKHTTSTMKCGYVTEKFKSL